MEYVWIWISFESVRKKRHQVAVWVLSIQLRFASDDQEKDKVAG